MTEEIRGELVTMGPNLLPCLTAEPLPVLDRLMAAAQAGMSADMIERFMDLAERNERREAEKAYNKAFADFKSDPPKIIKDQTVAYSGTKYEHASLGNVVREIIAGMSKHGLSHSWTLEQDKDNITVACKITHFLGHSESVAITAGADKSGGKNAIQSIASTITYLQRYTLQAATGIAVLEADDDGRGANDAGFPTATPERKTSNPKQAPKVSKPPANNKDSVEYINDADRCATPEALQAWYLGVKDEVLAMPEIERDKVNRYVKQLKEALSPPPDAPPAEKKSKLDLGE